MEHPIRQIRGRVYLRRARHRIGAGQFASIGQGSFVYPPATIIGHRYIEIGDDTTVHPRAFLSVVDSQAGRRYTPKLVIGSRVSLGFDFVVACCGFIEIQDDVLAADRVFIGDTYHDYRDVGLPVSQQPLADPRPVRIARGAFLGINSVILGGVSVGEGAYVAAGAVVTKDVPPRSLAAGVPARVIRRWDGERWTSAG